MSYNGLTTGTSLQGRTEEGKAVENTLMLSVIWRNTGKSPALKATIQLSHAIVGPDDSVPTFESPVSSDVGTLVVGPDILAQGDWRYILEADAERLRNGQKGDAGP
jgi:hypothetical protein